MTETVDIPSGRLLALNRSYVGAPVAQITITLTPTTGQWRVDGGAWQASGATVTGLAVGSHSVEYNSLINYTSPANETVTLTAGQSLDLSRSYTLQGGAPIKLKVNLSQATGKWRLDGGSWNNSGTTLYNLTPGSHSLAYSSVNGYSAPASETITLVSGPTTLDRTYTELAKLLVTLTPATAKWRLDGGAWQASGVTLFNLPLGTHTVEYITVTGYTRPPTETVTLPSGKTTLVRNYQ